MKNFTSSILPTTLLATVLICGCDKSGQSVQNTDVKASRAVFSEGGSQTELASLSSKLDDFDKLRNKLKFGVTNDEILEGVNNVDFAINSFVKKNRSSLSDGFIAETQTFSESLVSALKSYEHLNKVKNQLAGNEIFDTGGLYIMKVGVDQEVNEGKPFIEFFRQRLGDFNFLPWVAANSPEIIEAKINFKGDTQSKLLTLSDATFADLGKIPDKPLDEEDASNYFNADFLALSKEANFSSIEISLLYREGSVILRSIFNQLDVFRKNNNL